VGDGGEGEEEARPEIERSWRAVTLMIQLMGTKLMVV
jgi:hypothetical protein